MNSEAKNESKTSKVHESHPRKKKKSYIKHTHAQSSVNMQHKTSRGATSTRKKQSDFDKDLMLKKREKIAWV